MGVEAILAPLLVVRDLPGPIDLAGVGALAFTSANGVAAFARRSAARDLPVFAVGAATTAAARAAGFGEVISADGDVETLARLILARREPAGTLLHASAAEPAGDLVGQLRAGGQEARRIAVYETLAAEPPRRVLDSLDGIDGVILHSPRAARALADVLAGRRVVTLAASCLSPAVAAALEGLQIGQIRVAALPNEDALLSLIPSRRHE